MSMSKRLYLIFLLLIVVAIAIMVMGIYNIGKVADDAAALGRQGKRAVSVASVDRFLLERELLTNQIIVSSDSAEMQKIIDGPFKAVEAGIVAESEIYQSNFPSDPLLLAGLRTEVDQLFKLWGDYVKTTAEVAQLSLINSTRRAIDTSDAAAPMWDAIDDDLEKLATFLEQNKEPDIRVLNRAVRNGRTLFARFRDFLDRYANSTDAASFKKQEEHLMSLVAPIDQIVKGVIDKNLPASEGGDLARSVMQRLDGDGKKTIASVIELVNTNANGRAYELFNTKGKEQQQAVAAFAESMLEHIRSDQDTAISESAATVRSAFIMMIAISVVGILIGMALAITVIRNIGNRLNEIIGSLGESSLQVNAAASQISSSSQGLAEGSTEQAASLEETSSALEQMASMTRQNADNADKTNATTQNNNKLIGAGSTAVHNMSQAMAEISDSAEQINRIIKTIEDIAFQTNLLALNAAVEAARAGEAGKGFAVVADEVRNLAGRSAQAARDTTQLIQTTIERVRNGSEIAGELSTSFKEIEEGSLNVSRLISEISAATNEQAQGVDQVNTAVAQMDKVTQSNAATAEEAASAAEELSAQASALNGMVDGLVAMVRGGNGSDLPDPAVQAAGKRRSPERKVMRVRQLETSQASAPKSEDRKVKMLPASEVIPLDESDDF